MRCLIDTNVLLRAIDRNHPHSGLVRRSLIMLRRQGIELFFTPQNLIEFWAVATRPVDSNGLGMSVDWTAVQLSRIKRFFNLVADTPDAFPEWERLVLRYQVSGKKVHDARLVAAMKVNGISQILTFNADDFARYGEIRVIHPNQVSAQTE